MRGTTIGLLQYPSSTVVGAPETIDADALTGAGRVDHLPAPDIQPDVVDGAVEEHQVAGLQIGPRHRDSASPTACYWSAAGRCRSACRRTW